MVSGKFFHPFLCIAMPWMLLASVHAALLSVVSPSPSTTLASSITPSKSSGLSIITLPFSLNDYSEYEIKFAQNGQQDSAVSFDFLQPNLWLMDSDDIIPCSVAESYYSAYNYSDLPDVVTYNGGTYDPNECYINGYYSPKVTITRVSGSYTSTVTQASPVPTTSAYNITYPSAYYASGYFSNANFSFGTLNDNKTNDDPARLSLSGVKYLLTNESNLSWGSLGLAGPSWGGSVLDSLKSKGLIYGSGYSAYFYTNRTVNETVGYILMGAVDKKLYTGNLYSFSRIAHVGWGDANAILPIIQMDSVKLLNLQTAQSANIYTGPIGVMFDPTNQFSYLPRELMISLALQTNAYYATTYGSWLVNCSAINDANASLQFQFGPLNISIPLSATIVDSGQNLTFADGSPACTFNMFPSDGIGYAVFGQGFLPYVYMAMDNEGGGIALANANTLLNSNSPYSATTSSNTTTVGYIRSGSIPFAVNAQVTPAVTYTFGESNVTAALSDPGLLTNIVISSGHVYISQRRISSRMSVSASAASAKTTSGGAGSFKASLKKSNGSILPIILLLGGIMGVMFM